MSWAALHLHGAKERYYFKTGLITVGRKECDILVNDKSVSRKHAEFELQFNVEDVEKLASRGTLYLIDKSKFGTFVNGAKCQTPRQQLKEGDEIRFGVNTACTYRVCYQPLVLFWEPDSMPTALKSRTIKQIATYAGHLSHEWEGCTFSLLVDDSSLRHACLALLYGRPCIGPSWLTAIVERTVASSPLPEAIAHPPSMTAAPKGTFSNPDSAGLRTLLAGKTFVFLTAEQHREYAPVVTLSSGNAIEWSSVDNENSQVLSQNVKSCIVKPPPDNTRGIILATLEKFKMLGVNPIDATEIYQAILHRDVVKYCNPPITPVISITEDEKITPSPPKSTPAKQETLVQTKAEKHDKLESKVLDKIKNGKRKRSDSEKESNENRVPANIVNTSTPMDGEKPPPMLVTHSNLLARPLQTDTGPVNFKRFKKSRSLSSSDVLPEPTARVIKCVLEEVKPTEEMDSWLKENAAADRAQMIEEEAAEKLWESEEPKPKRAKAVAKAVTKKTPTIRRKSNFV